MIARNMVNKFLVACYDLDRLQIFARSIYYSREPLFKGIALYS